LIDPQTRDLGVRLIAADRPGFGGSDDQPGRSIGDWATDVAALADHLGRPCFTLRGVSAGDPYARGCASCSPSA
jgi:pimeloyl-ACP methyl ester carboxylesterase